MNRRDAIKRTSLLMGYAVSASAVAGIMGGCKTEGPKVDWEPAFLSKEHAAVITEMSETFLPHDEDIPGAKDVGVPEFIDQMLNNVYNAEEQQSFLEGLNQFEAHFVKEHGKSITQLPEDQREAALQAFHKTADDNKFYNTFRELALLGYLTSEEIGENVLAYDPVPGEYLGCIPYAEVGKRWSL